MPNITIYLTMDMYERIKNNLNRSELINTALEKYFSDLELTNLSQDKIKQIVEKLEYIKKLQSEIEEIKKK